MEVICSICNKPGDIVYMRAIPTDIFIKYAHNECLEKEDSNDNKEEVSV